MKTRKQLVSLLLVFCIMLALAPAAAAADSTYTPAVMPNQVFTSSFTSVRMTLPQLQEKFPEGRYWNGGNVDATTGAPCPSHANTNTCNCFTSDGKRVWQCYGFALKLGYDAYGSSPRSWSTTTDKSYVDSLKPGDIVDTTAKP